MLAKRIFKTIPHLLAILGFVVISVIYFYPQVEGKQIPMGDIMAAAGATKEIKDIKAKTGEDILWTNTMFGGMPTFQISNLQKNNVFKYIERAMNMGFSRPAGYFIFGCISFYILMILLGVNPWIAIIGALAFSFTTNNMILFEAGHASKIRVIMSAPILISGVLLVFRKKYWLGAGIFSLGMGLGLFANHYQMTYYLGMIIGILIVLELVKTIKEKDYFHILKGGVALLLGLIIALGTSSAKLLPTYEYSKDTMRGKPILETQGIANSSSEIEGLEYGYAMNWSNSVLDLFASFIPGVVGGASSEKVSTDSAFARELNRRGINPGTSISAPLYWGALPFTSGPAYFGAIICFLFIFGLFYIKGSVKWWLALSVLLTLVLSMGKYAGAFNEFIFNYLPLYNKFRTPNSILSITAVIMPILGLLAVDKFLKSKNREEVKKPLLISTGILALVCLFFILLGPSFFSFSSPGDLQYQQQGLDPSIFVADRTALMRSDAFRSLMLILLSGVLIWFYMKKKIRTIVLLSGLGLLIMFDIFGVDRRYLDHDSFVKKTRLEQQNKPRQVDMQILQDEALSYRVLDRTVNTFNSAATSYFHKTIGGYHPAKLQRYEDLIEKHIMQENGWVYNMLNTRYFIEPGNNNEPIVRVNSAALGNAWFVNSIRQVDNANQEIEALYNFDPAGEAIVHQEFADYISGLNPEKNGSIRLTEYHPEHLTYEYNTSGDQFAVFSEVWYGPNKGWQAYLDNEPVDHIRCNYALRGMRLPEGRHTVEFKFAPESYATGEKISRISSILFCLLLLSALFFKRKDWLFPDTEIVEPKKVSSPIAKTPIRKKRTRKKRS